jgi:hypothetical protein
MIPKNITREHILKALGEIDKKGVPKRRFWRKYRLSYQSRSYPCKYTISLANKNANNVELQPSEFNGGRESNEFLLSRGFEILGPI